MPASPEFGNHRNTSPQGGGGLDRVEFGRPHVKSPEINRFCTSHVWAAGDMRLNINILDPGQVRCQTARAMETAAVISTGGGEK